MPATVFRHVHRVTYAECTLGNHVYYGVTSTSSKPRAVNSSGTSAPPSSNGRSRTRFSRSLNK